MSATGLISVNPGMTLITLNGIATTRNTISKTVTSKAFLSAGHLTLLRDIRSPPFPAAEISYFDQAADHYQRSADDLKRCGYYAVNQRFRQHGAPQQRERDLGRIDHRCSGSRSALLRKNIQRLSKGDDKVSVDEQARDNSARPRERRKGGRLDSEPDNKAENGNEHGNVYRNRHRVVLLGKVVELNDKHCANNTAHEHDQNSENISVGKVRAQSDQYTDQHERR